MCTHVYMYCIFFRYGFGHRDFSSTTFTLDYGIGRMRCNGDEDSLVDCPDVEIGINGGINAPTCRNNADDLDVGIICSMTCNELF